METVETPQPVQPPEPKSSNWTKVILAAVLGLGLLAGSAYAGYYYGTQQVQQPEKPTPVVSQPTPKPTPTPEPAPDSTANWETYTNTSARFTIKYPKGWRKIETEDWVGFGPQEIGEDVIWGVSFYDKLEKTVSEIKDEMGKQFSDRKQSEETVTFNGLTTTKVVTTTDQYADWYSVTMIIDSGNMLYAIGNGAQTDTALNEMLLERTGEEYNISFEGFYSSFRLSK